MSTLEQNVETILEHLQAIAHDPDKTRTILERARLNIEHELEHSRTLTSRTHLEQTLEQIVTLENTLEAWKWGSTIALLAGITKTPELLATIAVAVALSTLQK